MRATSITFLRTEGNQMRLKEDSRVHVRVFFCDKKDKPAELERCERSEEMGVGRGKTCLVPTEGRSRRLDGSLYFWHPRKGGWGE